MFFDDICALRCLCEPTRSRKRRHAKNIGKPICFVQFRHTRTCARDSTKHWKTAPKQHGNALEKAMRSGSVFLLIRLALGSLLGTFWHPDGSQKAPKTPQVTPKTPQRVPKIAQEAPKVRPRLPKRPQRYSKRLPRDPKDPPRCPQEFPRGPQEVPERPPRPPKTSPRDPKDAPKAPKEDPKQVIYANIFVK